MRARRYVVISVKQTASPGELDERLAALLTNVNAVRAIASAVEGTIGPKGLNTMLVDEYGDVTITNDGITILENMEAQHPAARLVINTARSQEDQVGDGTTTATILAGTLVTEGFNQVAKGVPVTGAGLRHAIAAVTAQASSLTDLDDPRLEQAARVAGRDCRDLAGLVVAAAQLIGREKLLEPSCKLADAVVAVQGAASSVFPGIIVDREPLNDQMPTHLRDASILIIDDALAPDTVDDHALTTEAGFQKLLERQAAFRSDLAKLIDLGVQCVLVDRGVDDVAEDVLTDAGVLVLHRVAWRDWRKVAEHCGARPVKRSALHKPANDLVRFLGRAEEIWHDEQLKHLRLLGGTAKPTATILVGAATREVMAERERVARDAASAAQAALRSGLVPGGGAAELAAIEQVKAARPALHGMAGYGLDCVIEALRRPLGQIVHNAGFNALEKVGEVEAQQAQSGNSRLGVDCDTGQIVDMVEAGVLDPAEIKIHAMHAAGEIAQAILRIDTIIKRRQEGTNEGG